MIEVKGKGGTSAKIVADSISSVDGTPLTTFELEFHRFILPEFNTHRAISKNAASSRAIPVTKMLEHVRNNPAMPIHWGKNQQGMQANEECNEPVLDLDWRCGAGSSLNISREGAWKTASELAATMADSFNRAGYHKQIVNRLTEPFQMIKVVATATEWDNFFWLRLHKDAQPEIAELARCMWEAMQQSEPEVLSPGEWHTPYINHFDRPDGEFGIAYGIFGGDGVEQYLTLDEALKVSASCCAQVSYRKNDDSLEKADDIYNKLISGERIHASPFEHQATPIQWKTFGDGVEKNNLNTLPATWEEGITHMNRKGDLCSNNFCGWIQHRALIPNNVCTNFNGE